MSKRMLYGIMLVLFLTSILAVAFKIQTIRADLTASVYVDPPSQTVILGDSFTVSISANVSNLYGFEFKLYYDSTLMNGTQVTEGSFLKSGGGQTSFDVMNFTDHYNSTCGFLYIVSTLSGSVSGVSGDIGTLATITFKSTSTGGPKTLHLADVLLSGSSGTAIAFIAIDGEVTIITYVHFSVEPVAIAPLTNVNSSINGLEIPPTPSPVGQNFTVEIHLRNATSTNVPKGVLGLDFQFYFGNILAYAVPTGFTDMLGQAGGVLTGPGNLLYGEIGFYDASGVYAVSNPPYASAVYFEIAAQSTNAPWNGADGLVATINFRIIKQPQGLNGEPTVTLPLANDYTDIVDSTQSLIEHDSVQGTLSIDSTTGVSPPVANFSYSPLLPIAGESITFNASSSSPGWNGEQTVPIVSYTWDFGDNDTATGQVVAHAYADPGNYTVTLNVTDSEGLWLAEQRLIQVSTLASALFITKTIVGQGYGGNITVTVLNQGDPTETFNVTAYANTTAVVSQNVTPSSGNSINITLTWNTTGFAYGNYTISAYAWPVPGETNTANNNLTDGSIIVTIPGDLNGDFKVSLEDLVILANAYGSKPGDPNWNPNADIDNNGKVGLTDLTLLAIHYGQHYP